MNTLRGSHRSSSRAVTGISRGLTRPIRVRSLYVVPRRRIPRGRHVPAGRTLHLVDAENLMGGPFQGLASLKAALDGYSHVAPVAGEDHVITAINPGLVGEIACCGFRGRVVAGYGPDGADRALLEEIAHVAWVAAHYDRVVIGSGDGIFASAVTNLRAAGVAVGVVGLVGGVSRRLAESATFIRFLSRHEGEEVAA